MRRIISPPTGPTGGAAQRLLSGLSLFGLTTLALFAVAVVVVGLWKVATTVMLYVLAAVLLLGR